MTGEWIVYAQHENQNFYLCLAKHNDGDEDHYEKIRERIERICMREFPFLKDVFHGPPPERNCIPASDIHCQVPQVSLLRNASNLCGFPGLWIRFRLRIS